MLGQTLRSATIDSCLHPEEYRRPEILTQNSAPRPSVRPRIPREKLEHWGRAGPTSADLEKVGAVAAETLTQLVLTVSRHQGCLITDLPKWTSKVATLIQTRQGMGAKLLSARKRYLGAIMTCVPELSEALAQVITQFVEVDWHRLLEELQQRK